MNKIFRLSAGIFLSLTLLSGCSSVDDSAPTTNETTVAEDVAPEPGSIENPLPIGSTIDSTSDHIPISLSFPSLNMDGNEAVILPGFVPEPEPGFHWVVLTIQIANTSSSASDSVSAGDIGVGIELADATGQTYEGSFAMLVEGLDVIDDPFGGETVSGEMAYQVPDGSTNFYATYKGIFVVVI